MNNEKLINELLNEMKKMNIELNSLKKENELLREDVKEITQIVRDSFFYVV